MLIEAEHGQLSVRRQCELLGLNRSSVYYEPAAETAENLALMRRMDEEYTKHPFYGSRRMTVWLVQQGEEVNRKRVQRLMRVMGLEAIYPKPKLSVVERGHRIYPYLLRNVGIERVDQVWSTDITYIAMRTGFMYLAAVIDWYSCQATIIFPFQRQLGFPIALAPSKGPTTITFPDPHDSRACRAEPFPVTLSSPGETESGSAGTQPDKG